MSIPEISPETARLLEEIRAFMAESGISKTALGKAAVKDPSLVDDLENGRELRWQTMRRVREFMAGYPDQERAVS